MFHNFMMNFVATHLYLLAFNFDNVFKYSLYIVDTKKMIPILFLCVILMQNLFNRLHKREMLHQLLVQFEEVQSAKKPFYCPQYLSPSQQSPLISESLELIIYSHNLC
jgi:hypothetical protein